MRRPPSLSLTGRFSALFLAALALCLAAFATASYLEARRHLRRQVDERLTAALAVLAAAAEVHPADVEWEPQERLLPLGQDPGPDQLRWAVFDARGHRVDHSRNLDEADLTPAWSPDPGSARLPSRLVDRRGRPWRVEQRRLLPSAAPTTGSRSASEQPPAEDGVDPRGDPSEGFHRSLVLTAFAPMASTESMLAALGGSLIVGGVGVWLVFALLCRRISRRALSPLTRMAESARGLDASDPGWSLTPAGTGDELDELGGAFNDLLGRLHLAFERQRRFSGDASHQLRTPLTVLIGQIEVALRRDRPAEEYRHALQTALGGALQLRRVVEALLFLARAEGESQVPDAEPIGLGHLVADHLAARPEAESGRIVHRPGDGDGPTVRAHPALLDQLLVNLLENAASHGGPAGRIVVETGRRGDAALLAVEDSGPGIPAEDLPRVLEPFYRSSQARRLGVPGVGLGLAVVDRIARLFGGEVAVRSEPGRGCRVEVRLPVDPEAG